MSERAADRAAREGAAAVTPPLAVRELHAWYDESHILHGVDFDVRPGEVVTLLGRNGAGKTTTLKSIMGIVGKRKGSASTADLGAAAVRETVEKACAIARYTAPGDLVADPMCGIGTTLVEAVHQGRNALGIEYEPRWAAVTHVRRPCRPGSRRGCGTRSGNPLPPGPPLAPAP